MRQYPARGLEVVRDLHPLDLVVSSGDSADNDYDQLTTSWTRELLRDQRRLLGLAA